MEKVLIKGNEAIAEAAMKSGCKLFFGYPITPQNEICEYMAKYLPKNKGVFVHGKIYPCKSTRYELKIKLNKS